MRQVSLLRVGHNILLSPRYVRNGGSFCLADGSGVSMRKGLFTIRNRRTGLTDDAGEPRHAVPVAQRASRLIIGLLLAAPIFSSHAQTLYRCVESGKPTSFQSDRCPSTAKTTSATNYVPERNVPPLRSTPAPAPRHRRTAAGGRLHNIPRAVSPSACEQAKQRREYVLGRNNQDGNVDVRRQLNDTVARACN